MAPPYGIRGEFVEAAEKALEGVRVSVPERVHGANKLRVARLFEATHAKAWTNGFGLALAEASRHFAQETAIKEVCRAAGFTAVKQFAEAGLEEYDLKELRKCLR